MNTAVLLLSCPDRRGIVAAISEFIYQNHGNILHFDQHTNQESNKYFMRMEWELDGFDVKPEEIGKVFQPVAEKFDMDWQVRFPEKKQKLALMVSKVDHCLYEILLKQKSGELNVEIPVIISNHEKLRPVAEDFGIDYICIPVSKENKPEAENQQLEMLKKYEADGVILARYMQILSPKMIEVYKNRIINIHHSFLPAFKGARPYHQAYERGVKIIGATSHYVSEELDNGPIIFQDVILVSHRDSVKDLIRKGRDLERSVLFRAVKNHTEHKVLVFGNRTVVFE